MTKRISTIMLLQPNYSIFGKRTWKLIPYNLGILSACLKDKYDVYIYDHNFDNTNISDFHSKLTDLNPDVVGITSFSTEYIEEIRYFSKEIKKVLPKSIVVLGGIVPTVWINKIIDNTNIDYFIMGEGEYRLPALLDALNSGINYPKNICGIAFRDSNNNNVIHYPTYYIDDLDCIPFPDYGNLNFFRYGNYSVKYSSLIPRQFPFATTITSRGCPYKCIFCAASTVSGKKVRMRSSGNVIEEIDMLVTKYGVREIIFSDDHFLHNINRAREIINGIIKREYNITWKCANLAVWSLKEDILELMRQSGSYQITLSIESGNQYVVNKLIKKPVNLEKAKERINLAKSMGFEIIVNFIIGTPGETWDQIRESLKYAEDIDVDVINIHIATPLPKTELMEICLREGLLDSEDDYSGYTKSQIETKEFTGFELQILRAFEWDRINFKSQQKIMKVASIYGLSEVEVENWRKETRLNLGATSRWKERFCGK